MASFPAQPHPNTLSSTRTLVIGGTSGLGAAVVSALLANNNGGSKIHIVSSNPSKIQTKITEFNSLYPTNETGSDGNAVTGTAADLSNETTLEATAKQILSEAVTALGGPLDHIVYTAGDAYRGTPMSSIDGASYFKSWNVRFLAPLLIAKAISCSPPGTYLKAEASSSITLTSGLLAHKPVPGVSHFIGWAGAIEALARGLAVDMAPIRCNVVCPGAIHTEMLAGVGEEGVKRFGEGTLRKSVGTPAEAAEAYLFCLRSAFLTGEIIKVDGGAAFA